MIQTVIRTLTPTAWLIVGVLVAFLLFGAFCSYRGVQGRQEARAGQTLAEGRTAAAQDASAVRDANDAATQSTREQVKEDQDAIRRETDPDARDRLARERLCKLNPGACPS
ncbi:hypothetical protein [Brevundimonas nasdae]|uniref:Lipoprotein n=1 Tax=Brevundimonas nasdae TaxID=172043 RepID=A0ABX8TH38_9CAUL|nr:hypothetical protein [Brevundimonas nasdae]QYC10551.1 hypothetical protein KWG56_00565 [Brevundimonas nasdae]QYC13338.1 hypothetical protein KWG63_14120 [Brevundimonas nasdae]